MLAEGLANHRGSLLASLQIESGINLRSHPFSPPDLAEIVVNLPPGCAFWRSFGGPLSLTDEAHILRAVEYDLQILAWRQTEDGQKGRNPPEPPAPPRYAHERAAEEERTNKRLAAWRRRTNQ